MSIELLYSIVLMYWKKGWSRIVKDLGFLKALLEYDAALILQRQMVFVATLSDSGMCLKRV